MTGFAFQTGGPTVLPPERVEVFFDGIFSEPRLQHPEGIAIGPGGAVWCGSENGQVLCIDADGGSIREVASTGGFALGLAFHGSRALFVCDLRFAAVFRLDLATNALRRFTEPGIRVPNYPVVDARRGRLLVSDSRMPAEPGIWSFDLETGRGGLWFDRPLLFANGMALAPGGDALLVCETFACRVTRVAINPDGTAGAARPYAENLPGLPDGLAFDQAGALFVSCYEPSRILRVPPGGGAAEVYAEDPTAHTLAHPTNIAFAGPALYAANLGRWHVTRLDTDTAAPPLWEASA